MKFTEHIERLTAKIGSLSFVLSRLKDFPSRARELVFDSCVIPHLLYSDFIILFCPKTLYKSLRRKVKSCSSKASLRELDIVGRTQISVLIFLYSIYQGKHATYLRDTLVNRQHSHDTRDGATFQRSICKYIRKTNRSPVPYDRPSLFKIRTARPYQQQSDARPSIYIVTWLRLSMRFTKSVCKLPTVYKQNNIDLSSVCKRLV